jgi:osmoprotectant transport system permease protein
VRPRGAAALLATAAALGGCADPGPKPAPGPPVVVASKAFTESVILGEIATDVVRGAGLRVEHRQQLGGTKVVWRALEMGAVDVYPDYTGTLYEEILRDETPHRTLDELDAALARRGLRRTAPLGFDNGYALAMTEGRAEALGVRRISDLAGHPDLRLVFSNEVMDRRDGWPGLRARYALPQTARGMDHDLAYRALDAGSADVMDIYATDAEIRAHHLRVLEDDRGYFPSYAALYVYRAALADRTPSPVPALRRLEGRFTAPGMIALNARAKLDHVPESQVAVDFLRGADMQAFVPPGFARALAPPRESAVATLGRHAAEHTTMVLLSLLAAIAVGVPLGVVAARRPRVGKVVVGAAGLLQTVPSIALLVLLIPLVGIGTPPALVALFLYGLLPIVRNTHTGLVGIPEPLRDSARALGLRPGARLRLVELPLALPAIVAGIKTSAVIAVGTATIGALVGAGGFGQPILTGIRLDDFSLILQGAVPAAAMALALEWIFDAAERRVVPRGLRKQRGT